MDTSSNGPEGGPIHAPSPITHFHLQAGLLLSDFSLSNQVLRARFGPAGSKDYVLEASPVLPATDWTTVTNITGTPQSELRWIAETNTTAPARFYRIREGLKLNLKNFRKTPSHLPNTQEKRNIEMNMTPIAPKPGVRQAAIFARSWITLAATFLAANSARAHLTYGVRDFGSFSGLTNGSATITNQTVTGNSGWADAADGVLADSHHGRAFRFRLQNPAFVSLTVSANPTATTNSLGGLTPAFSIYSGLAALAPFAPTQTDLPAAADYDGTAASLAWRIAWVKQNLDPNATTEAPTDGCWNSVGDFKIGGDGDLPGDFSQLSSLTYKGSSAATIGANTVTGSLALPAGDYTIMVGGNNIASKTSDTALSGFGISVKLSVAPTPILSITSKVFVARPTGITGNWKLQFATSLNASEWTDLTATAVIVDGQAGVVLDVGATQQYFRFVSVP